MAFLAGANVCGRCDWRVGGCPALPRSAACLAVTQQLRGSTSPPRPCRHSPCTDAQVENEKKKKKKKRNRCQGRTSWRGRDEQTARPPWRLGCGLARAEAPRGNTGVPRGAAQDGAMLDKRAALLRLPTIATQDPNSGTTWSRHITLSRTHVSSCPRPVSKMSSEERLTKQTPSGAGPMR